MGQVVFPVDGKWFTRFHQFLGGVEFLVTYNLGPVFVRLFDTCPFISGLQLQSLNIQLKTSFPFPFDLSMGSVGPELRLFFLV